MRAVLFPGQGSQKIGMGKSLHNGWSACRAVFEEVDEALGDSLSQMIFEGDIETLTLTENTQPALMAVSVASVRALEAETGRGIGEIGHYLAGHSLGEYSALAAIGSISLTNAARLLRLRGLAMQRAVPAGAGAMAAVIGLSTDLIDAVLNEEDCGVCDIANDNANGQTVISGAKEAVAQQSERLKKAGAKKIVMLQVSAPFHCQLLQPAALEMEEALAVTAISDPAIPMISNVTAKSVSDADEIRKLLVRQVTATVRWREMMLEMSELGVQSAVEAGEGQVLSGLMKRTVKGLTVSPMGHADQIKGLAEAMGDV